MHNLIKLLAFMVCLLSAPAFADTTVVPEDLRAVALADAVTPGWKDALSLGTTLSFGQSQGVVGSPDGISAQIGIMADGQAAYANGPHTWTSALKLNYAQSKTPALTSFVKSADMLDLSTTYTYRILKWLGPYARGRFSTQIADGFLYKSTPYGMTRLDAAGNKLDANPVAYGSQNFAQLTGSFDPMLFGESVGLFANPTESDAVTVRFKLGLGSQQLVTSLAYTVADDKDVNNIQVKQIQNATQVGGELEAAATGAVSKFLRWKAKAAFFMPFYTNIGNTATGMDALNMDFSAGASYQLAKWLSLDYVFLAKKVPLISQNFQIVNGAVLTVGFIL